MPNFGCLYCLLSEINEAPLSVQAWKEGRLKKRAIFCKLASLGTQDSFMTE